MKNKRFSILLLTLLLVVFSVPACTRQYGEELVIYFERSGDIYQISESGDKLTLLLSGGTYDYPCSSADGNYLLCRTGSISAVYDLETLTQRVTFSTASPYTHSWSADGSMISVTDGPGQINVYNAATGTLLWSGAFGGYRSHCFTNDSRYITGTSGTTFNEYLPEIDTTPERTRTLPGTYYNISLSPDGKRIAGDDTANVVILNEETLVLLNSFPGTQPSWSPDNETIVYNSGGNLYLYNTQNGDMRALTFSGSDSYPCYRYKPR